MKVAQNFATIFRCTIMKQSTDYSDWNTTIQQFFILSQATQLPGRPSWKEQVKISGSSVQMANSSHSPSDTYSSISEEVGRVME